MKFNHFFHLLPSPPGFVQVLIGPEMEEDKASTGVVGTSCLRVSLAVLQYVLYLCCLYIGDTIVTSARDVLILMDSLWF